MRIACLVIGYAFGLIQTGYWYSKLRGVNLREHGSGNFGTTNAMRVMGKKAGAIVFVGDVLKVFLACLVTVLLFNGGKFYQGSGLLILIYTGFGVVLGHNFPFYLNFKGGKGIAATAAMLLVLDVRIAAICLVVFILVVALTKYVSLGSIVISLVFLITWIVLGQTGSLSLTPSLLPESYVVIAVWVALNIWQHRANIRRLLAGTENKIGQKKKRKE